MNEPFRGKRFYTTYPGEVLSFSRLSDGLSHSTPALRQFVQSGYSLSHCRMSEFNLTGYFNISFYISFHIWTRKEARWRTLCLRFLQRVQAVLPRLRGLCSVPVEEARDDFISHNPCTAMLQGTDLWINEGIKVEDISKVLGFGCRRQSVGWFQSRSAHWPHWACFGLSRRVYFHVEEANNQGLNSLFDIYYSVIYNIMSIFLIRNPI